MLKRQMGGMSLYVREENTKVISFCPRGCAAHRGEPLWAKGLKRVDEYLFNFTFEHLLAFNATYQDVAALDRAHSGGRAGVDIIACLELEKS